MRRKTFYFICSVLFTIIPHIIVLFGSFGQSKQATFLKFGCLISITLCIVIYIILKKREIDFSIVFRNGLISILITLIIAIVSAFSAGINGLIISIIICVLITNIYFTMISDENKTDIIMLLLFNPLSQLLFDLLLILYLINHYPLNIPLS